MFKTSLLLALVTIPALAAPQVSEHERALQKAKKWSDVTAQLKGRLPSNVVKEFADFAKDEEFPATRRIKNKLVITDSDGTKVTIEYKKDGAISLNGKDWKLRPLATVEEEVTRLALFINGEKKASSGFMGLIPAAQAGGAAMGGAAIAAFAGANAWKAESCGEKELRGDLLTDCAQMAVKMQPILVKMQSGDSELFRPISLKCPIENKGTLELLSKNAIGQFEKVQITYKNENATKVVVSVAEKNSSFESWLNVNLAGSADEMEMDMAKQAVAKYGSLRGGVCEASKEKKKRYFASLESNRKELVDGSNNSNSNSDDEATMEAI